MRTKIIAELASCHNGNPDMAKALVRAASEAGVDIVKFQSWKASDVKDTDPDKKRYEQLEFRDEWHRDMISYCRQCGIEFLTTVFDIKRIPFLRSLGQDSIKVASYDMKNYRLLSELKKNFKKIYVSTGGSYPEEIQKAAEILKGHDYTLLHCVLSYPTPFDQANLAKIDWLRQFAPSVGFSDHTGGTEAAKVAIAMGIDVLEKHFTLSRFLPQPLHTTSTEPDKKPTTTHEIAIEFNELKEICDHAKLVEKIKGDGSTQPKSFELPVREKYTGRLCRDD
ncbi:MAG TPA: N-acetylneuraminate synthase family protein [Candidatus Methylomirabilis sp.]|nr:N-acetylneuraminate synthase family protein [Candidatus Methylomirabilis sp.]